MSLVDISLTYRRGINIKTLLPVYVPPFSCISDLSGNPKPSRKNLIDGTLDHYCQSLKFFCLCCILRVSGAVTESKQDFDGFCCSLSKHDQKKWEISLVDVYLTYRCLRMCSTFFAFSCNSDLSGNPKQNRPGKFWSLGIGFTKMAHWTIIVCIETICLCCLEQGLNRVYRAQTGSKQSLNGSKQSLDGV